MPEVIVASHCGLQVIAFGVITDMCLPHMTANPTVEEILQVARNALPNISTLIRGLIKDL